eukprot:scaffold9957_cov107-Isochrysis_galbana.AAC.7
MMHVSFPLLGLGLFGHMAIIQGAFCHENENLAKDAKKTEYCERNIKIAIAMRHSPTTTIYIQRTYI